MSIQLMTHMVAGYPGPDRDLSIARGMIAGGSDFLEIQFPFSDPSADGPVIQNACSHALEKGFRLQQGFELVKKIRLTSEIPVFIMTYAAMAVRHGIGIFLDRCVDAGVTGVIIPDLPPFEDEGLRIEAFKRNLHCVTVVAPTIDPDRLTKILGLKEEYLYTALRTGITGVKTQIDDKTKAFLAQVRGHGKKILAGFGIQDREQVVALEGEAYSAIVGSYLVDLISKHEDKSNDSLLEIIKEAVSSLKS